MATQDNVSDNGKLTRRAMAVAAAGSICVGDGMNAQNNPTATAPEPSDDSGAEIGGLQPAAEQAQLRVRAHLRGVGQVAMDDFTRHVGLS